MRRRTFLAALAAGGLTTSLCSGADGLASKAQRVLDQSAAADKYTFVLFYKEENAATRKVAQVLANGVAKRSDQATYCTVAVSDPSEQALVKRFGVARAPMPLVLAIAPNGAMTAHFSAALTDANIESSFVTASMAECMRAMQDQKLVFVCLSASSRSVLPTGVKGFQTDPDFKNRVVVIPVHATDPAERQFLEQMEVDPANVKADSIVFLAPPAVLVGKFPATATAAEMAAALHKAGKCCDDPNCKHAHGPQATKNTNTKRN